MNRLSERVTYLRNGKSIAIEQIPWSDWETFKNALSQQLADGMRVSAYFGSPTAQDEKIEIFAILADDAENRLAICRTRIEGTTFASLTPLHPELHLFEREIAEQFGIVPDNHPWLKPVRYLDEWKRGKTESSLQTGLIGSCEYFRVEGDEIHEVAVGPVHAGIIEPGHFRFQCHGEKVFHLEISLGYQYRGIEKAILSTPSQRILHYMETAAGDTTVAHSIAYSQIVEGLSGCQVPPRALGLRAIALELERIANHVGDLGALANDVGFLPTASYCGRIRGDFLNLTALLCGNRFGRGFIKPGGVRFDLDKELIESFLQRLNHAMVDTRGAVELLWSTPSVMARFDETGPLPKDICKNLGMVGPAARASGLTRDIRHDQPSGIYHFAHIPVSTWNTGDVFARAFVRWLEIQQSFLFIQEQARTLPGGPISTPIGNAAANHLSISMVEGWRGEICHVALTDSTGKFRRYKLVDPSFHNWTGLAYALRNQQISDFPLCNKSFNLSYCGYDL